jgi:hypothetical protein
MGGWGGGRGLKMDRRTMVEGEEKKKKKKQESSNVGLV